MRPVGELATCLATRRHHGLGEWVRTAERPAAEAAAKAKRAEAERRAIAEAEKIVAIWNARQASGRALWFYPTIGAQLLWGSHGSAFRAPPAVSGARSICARVGGAHRTRRLPGWKC
jgi:hypothetical protein